MNYIFNTIFQLHAFKVVINYVKYIYFDFFLPKIIGKFSIYFVDCKG